MLFYWSNCFIVNNIFILAPTNNKFICLNQDNNIKHETNYIKTDLDSELMLFNEEANEVIYVLAWIIVINIVISNGN